ncbi:MAG TPA: hypothetical protein VGB39_05280, partial [Sphingomicrobium sp.]
AALAAMIIVHMINIRVPQRVWMILACVSAGAVGVAVYVFWPGYLISMSEIPEHAWPQEYGPVAHAWTYVCKETPADAVIAYTNMHFVHPLHGFENRRRVVYVPTRRGVKHLADLPPLAKPFPGEKLTTPIDALTIAEPDHQQWLDGIRASGATYLFIRLNNPDHPGPVPEEGFAAGDPQHFQPVFEAPEGAAVIYRIFR